MWTMFLIIRNYFYSQRLAKSMLRLGDGEVMASTWNTGRVIIQLRPNPDSNVHGANMGPI